MPKLKAVLLLVLSVGLILTLSGCGLLFSQSADQEEVKSDPGIELPEWLLLAHRSTGDLRAEEDQEPAMPKSDEEDDEDKDIEVTAEPDPETAAPASQEQPVSQPAPATQPAQSSSPAEEEIEESSGPSKSQQMLAESWNQRQDQDDQSDNDIDKGDEDESWWNPSKQNFTHDKPDW